LIKEAMAIEIKIQKPKKFRGVVEKISKKNPAKRAL